MSLPGPATLPFAAEPSGLATSPEQYSPQAQFQGTTASSLKLLLSRVLLWHNQWPQTATQKTRGPPAICYCLYVVCILTPAAPLHLSPSGPQRLSSLPSHPCNH